MLFKIFENTAINSVVNGLDCLSMFNLLEIIENESWQK